MPSLVLIEDETTLRESLVKGLSRQPDLEVSGAGTLDEALALIDAHAPDLIISDLDLPERSGIELIGELGRRDLRIPVVFVSAYVQAFGAQIPRHASLKVLEKPVPLQRLRQVVRSYLGASGAAEAPVLSVAECLQMACLGRRTVAIHLNDGPTVVGHVIAHRGELWAAEDQLGSGGPAFLRMAFASGPGVSCTTLDTEPQPRSIQEPWESLLLGSDSGEESSGDESSGEESSGQDVHSPPAAPERQAEPGGHLDELLDAGMDALLAKDYKRALRCFEEAERLVPGHRVAAANIARLVEMGTSREE